MIVATLALAISLSPATWKRYDIGPAQISLELPAPMKRISDPKDKNGAVWLADGSSSAVTIFTYDVGDEPLSLEAQLAALVFNLSDGPELKLDSMKDDLRQGWPGLTASGKSHGTPFRLVAFAFEKKIVAAQVQSAQLSTNEAAFSRVYSSLKFLPSVSKGTRTVAGPQFQTYPVGANGFTVAFPEAPRPIQPNTVGATAQFGSRIYLVMELPIPADIDPKDDKKLDRYAAGSIKSFIAGAGGEINAYENAKLGGESGVAVIYSVKKARATGRVIGVRRKGFVYLASALVPDVMKNAPEVETFFQSVKFIDPKSP